MLTHIVKVAPLRLPPPCLPSYFFNGVFWAPKHPITFAWGVLGDKTPHPKWGVLGNFADGVFWKWGVFGCIRAGIEKILRSQEWASKYFFAKIFAATAASFVNPHYPY